MKISRLVLLILIPFLLSTCSKRPFAHVEVKGRVVSMRTGRPLTGAISLWIDARQNGTNGSMSLVNSRTTSDGTFSIKCRAQWKGNKYYLEIVPDSIFTYSTKDVSLPISKGQSVNTGDIKL